MEAHLNSCHATEFSIAFVLDLMTTLTIGLTTFNLTIVYSGRMMCLQLWDDVERKTKTKENPYEYKKRIVLDQEKSKQSLADVYEQEYLKQIHKVIRFSLLNNI